VTSPGNYVRQNRIKLALWIAVVEGVLTLVGLFPHWVVYGLAVIAIAFYVAAGRNYRSTLGRESSWVFAVSQAAAVLVPVVWFIARWVAITAIAVIAVVALIFLFMERDRSPHVERPE
jgi:hypothetical protein